MKQSEFLRWLIEQGVESKDGKKHLKLYFNDKRSTMPRHPNKEIATGTMKAIIKQLGIEE